MYESTDIDEPLLQSRDQVGNGDGDSHLLRRVLRCYKQR